MNKVVPILVLGGALGLGLAVKTGMFTRPSAGPSSLASAPDPLGQTAGTAGRPDDSPAPADAVPLATPPKQDLVLTDLTGPDSAPSAPFTITEPDKASTRFTIHAGEQNEWLEVRSIDLKNDTVKAVLKKPVVRIRNAGTEVVLSFPIHGARRS
jgi:hypothetical protein